MSPSRHGPWRKIERSELACQTHKSSFSQTVSDRLFVIRRLLVLAKSSAAAWIWTKKTESTHTKRQQKTARKKSENMPESTISAA